MQHPTGSRQGRESSVRAGTGREFGRRGCRQMKRRQDAGATKWGGAEARATKEKRPDGEVGAQFPTKNIILQNVDLSSG